MPHVTFGENYPARQTLHESRSLAILPKKKEDTIVLRRSRSISYKLPEEKSCRPVKSDDNLCIERKITYRDHKGNIIKITYEDSCGNVTKTIYPNPPPPPPKECRPPSPPPKCKPTPVCEPKPHRCDDRKCEWTKIVVRNNRGVVWKVVHVDCYGRTMKTEYPEPEPYKPRSSETRRYIVKEIDPSPPRRRYSETKKIVVDKEVDASPPRRRYSETKKIVIDKEVREPTPKRSDDNIMNEKRYESRTTVRNGNDSRRSEEYFDFFPTKESVTDSSTTSRRDSVADSSSRQSSDSDREVIKDENGVIRKVTYTDSRGRRRTVVYDD